MAFGMPSPSASPVPSSTELMKSPSGSSPPPQRVAGLLPSTSGPASPAGGVDVWPPHPDRASKPASSRTCQAG